MCEKLLCLWFGVSELEPVKREVVVLGVDKKHNEHGSGGYNWVTSALWLHAASASDVAHHLVKPIGLEDFKVSSCLQLVKRHVWYTDRKAIILAVADMVIEYSRNDILKTLIPMVQTASLMRSTQVGGDLKES